MIGSVCVFCGSSPGSRPIYVEAAQEVGRLLASRSWSLVYGGGRVGLMGRVAESTLAAGGKVYGVIPDFLNSKEIAHEGVTHLEVVDTMHRRKARMEELADAFLALPGGFGTYEELMEIITWGQLGLHRKPIGVLNLSGYYDPMLAQIDLGIREGFIKPEYRELIVSATTPAEVLDKLANQQVPQFKRWVDTPLKT